MPIKFLYSLFCLLTGVLSAMSSRAAGPGVINLLPSDYRAANKNWAVAEDDAGTLYAGNDKGLLEFDGLQWRLYELPRASIVRSVAPLSHDVIFTGGFEEFGRWDRDASGALRYTSLVPAQRNPRFSDSDFWKIYITPQGVLFQSFHGIYLYDYERVRRLTGEMNMLFLLRAGDAAVKHIAKAAEHQTEDCQQRVAGDGQPDAGHGRQQAEVGQNDRVIIETNHK